MEVLDRLKFISYAPVLFISALTGQRVQQVWDMVTLVYAEAGKRIPTGILNELIGEAQMALQPPMEGGRRLKIFYATQQGFFPHLYPFCERPYPDAFSYERYLHNQIRNSFQYTGTPLRIILRGAAGRTVYDERRVLFGCIVSI